VTRTTRAKAKSPAEQVFVLHERPLRPGWALEDTSRFRDDVWILTPALIQRHQQALQINFRTVPEPYRLLAKTFFYVKLSGDLPPGEDRVGVSTIRSTSTEIRRFLNWLDEQFDHPPLLSDLSVEDLEKYRKHVVKTLTTSRRHLALAAVRQLWKFRNVLPDQFAFDPLEACEDWSIPHTERSENTTPRIPDQVLGPLFAWALRFVDDFSSDIISVQHIWLQARSLERQSVETGEPVPLLEFLDTHMRDGRPLPGYNGKPNIKFISDITGVSRMRLRNRNTLIERVAAEVGVSQQSLFPIAIKGELDGEPWIDGIASDHNADNGQALLAIMLQTACYVVISFLSGMRDSEVKHLRRGCIQASMDANGNAYRWRIHSTAFKGENDVNGVEATWVVAPAVARAVRVLEELHKPETDYLFTAVPNSPGGQKPAPGRTLKTNSTRWQLNRFREWINNYCQQRQRSDFLPDVNGQPWIINTSQFRRTLAWFIAREPGGSIAGAIQYRHLSIQMFEGYAGTSDSGFRAEVEAEEALARGEVLLSAVEHHDHEKLTGPAADEAKRRLTELGTRTFEGAVVIDRKRLARIMKSHDPAIYPGKYSTCIFNPDKALCRKKASIKGVVMPRISECQPLECRNVALTESNVLALRSEVAELEVELAKKPSLPPLLQKTIERRIDDISAFLARQ